MSDVLGTLMTIASLAKKAYLIYTAMKAAPDEIRHTADQAHCMHILLETMSSDLSNNPHSYLHQHSAQAKAHKLLLKRNIKVCGNALLRMDGLLQKYHKFRGAHVSTWDKFRWSTDGKQEIAHCKMDLVVATNMLNIFLSKNSEASILWGVERIMEKYGKRVEALELAVGSVFNVKLPQNPKAKGHSRGRSGSNAFTAIVIGLVLSRLRNMLRSIRRRRSRRSNPPNPRRLTATKRVNSGMAPNKRRDALMRNYASTLASSAKNQNQNQRNKARTPSPDFHVLPGDAEYEKPLIRRSSSMQRLMGSISVHTAAMNKPRQRPPLYICYRIKTSMLAIGLPGPIDVEKDSSRYRRGQAQIKKMTEIFNEMSYHDGRGVSEKLTVVRLLLEKRNKKERDDKTGKKWHFVAGRVLERDPGRTGGVVVEKSLIVLVRR